MSTLALRIKHTYLWLLLGNTLAASFIWGINTLFLLNAGLNNFEAFAANAFFTAGMVLFEIPTGIVADTWGRRASYLLGTITLATATTAYYFLGVVGAPFWLWAFISALLGLGFTFFSGALEAWLVDALKYAQYAGNIEEVFGRGQIVSGAAMLAGSVLGGIVAQTFSLSAPFLFRVAIFCGMFVIAYVFMKDLGFVPERNKKPLEAIRTIFTALIEHGVKNSPVRWLMLAAPFSAGVGIYTFYALQPYLLSLHGDAKAYTVAGLAAAIVASSQIAGGFLAPKIRVLFKKRTTVLILGTLVSAIALACIGLVNAFAVSLFLLALWGLVFAAMGPVRQAYLNDLIPSQQRATILSFDALVGSSGGVVIQPALGKSADIWGYGISYVIGAGITLIGLPFLLKSRMRNAPSDTKHG